MAEADALEQVLDAESERLHPPAELLRPTEPLALVGHSLAQWALIGLCWVGMALGPAWAYPLWALVIATRIHAFGVILHDACHMPPLRLRRWGPLIELLSGYPCASTIAAMRYHHLRHHRDSCMETDPYRKPDLRGRPVLLALYWLRTALILPAWVVRGFWGSLAVHVPALRHPYGRYLLQDRSGQDLRDSAAVLACARAERGQALVHAGVIALACVFPGPVLRGFVGPALLASLLCGWRLLQEHSYERVTDRGLDAVLRTTRDHNLRPPMSLLFAPLHIGHHVVHHLHPQVGMAKLEALTAWYRAQLGERYPATRTWRTLT